MKEPMLAKTAVLSKIKYPVLASPKLDGIRCLIVKCAAVSRKFKPIPNHYTRSLFSRASLDGFDGELIVGNPGAPDCYNVTDSGVMTREGEPDVRYYVFDDFTDINEPFWSRIRTVYKRIG